MSNSLKDHMAEVLLRAILARPDKCPPELARDAKSYWIECKSRKAHQATDLCIRLERNWSRALREYAADLPAILADYEP